MFETFTNWMFKANTWNDFVVLLAVLAVVGVIYTLTAKD